MKQAVKTIIPFVLLLVTICIVTFSYAAYSTNLIIGMEGVVKSYKEDITVTNVAFSTLTNATEVFNPEFTTNTATFHISLNNTSTVVYNVTIANNTDVDKKISRLNIVKTNDNVDLDKNALSVGTVIPANSTITITYEISTSETTDQSDDIRLEYSFIDSSVTRPYINHDDTYNVDVLNIGDEKFFVVSNTNGQIKAFAMYNLYVGNIYRKASSTLLKNINQYDGDYNRQSSDARGNADSLDIDRITYAYGGHYWNSRDWGVDIYNSNSYMYEYLENYEDYIHDYYGVDITASMMNVNTLNQLGCAISLDNNASNDSCASAPDWVKNTSFWTQTTANARFMYGIYLSGGIGIVDSVNMYQFGLRPFITINSSDVEYRYENEAVQYSSTYSINGNNYNVTIININGEKFYKLRDDGNNIIALAAHNLDPSIDEQFSDDTGTGYIAYSNTNYWMDGNNVKPQYGNLITYVYDSNSNLYPHIESYKSKLQAIDSSINVRLMGWNDFLNFATTNNPPLDVNRPYLYSTSYWTGLAETSDSIIQVQSTNTGSGPMVSTNSTSCGIRPVLVINSNNVRTIG